MNIVENVWHLKPFSVLYGLDILFVFILKMNSPFH